MLSSRTKTVLITASVVILLFMTIGVLFGQSDDKDKLYKKFDIFIEVMNRIRNDYVEPVQPSLIFDGALKGMASTLDSESSYLTALEYKKYQEELSVRTASTGIGVVKHPGNNYAMVACIRPDSPAAESGLQVGDFIRAIDKKSTRDLPIMLIDMFLLGEEDSIVEFSVVRGGTQGLLTYEVPRKKLPELAVTYSIIEGIGYISIPTFRSYVLEDVQNAANQIKQAGVSELIIDVRKNVYGDLEEAVHVAELFISGGKLLEIKSQDKGLDYTANEFTFDFNNIQVLSNETTARAAEAFALIMKERKRATILGRNTLGLGTVQKDIELNDGAFLRISYGVIIGSEGTELQGNGVAPDVEIENTTDNKNGTDMILDAAIKRAKENSRKAA